jgi:hypothetical protein
MDTHTSILHVPSQCAKGRLTFNCTLTVRSTFTFTLSQINLFHLTTLHFNTSVCPVVSVRTARSNTGHSAFTPHSVCVCVTSLWQRNCVHFRVQRQLICIFCSALPYATIEFIKTIYPNFRFREFKRLLLLASIVTTLWVTRPKVTIDVNARDCLFLQEFQKG